MFNTTILTSVFAALLMAASLKFLHFFDFIQWSAVGWSKKWHLFTDDHIMHYFVNWLLLILALTVLFAIVYIIISFLYKIPPSITAIVIGMVFVLIIEWFISKPDTIKDTFLSISIPLLAISAIIFRFIAGTAVFMRNISTENPK